jgi:hypothetical protein
MSRAAIVTALLDEGLWPPADVGSGRHGHSAGDPPSRALDEARCAEVAAAVAAVAAAEPRPEAAKALRRAFVRWVARSGRVFCDVPVDRATALALGVVDDGGQPLDALAGLAPRPGASPDAVAFNRLYRRVAAALLDQPLRASSGVAAGSAEAAEAALATLRRAAREDAAAAATAAAAAQREQRAAAAAHFERWRRGTDEARVRLPRDAALDRLRGAPPAAIARALRPVWAGLVRDAGDDEEAREEAQRLRAALGPSSALQALSDGRSATWALRGGGGDGDGDVRRSKDAVRLLHHWLEAHAQRTEERAEATQRTVHAWAARTDAARAARRALAALHAARGDVPLARAGPDAPWAPTRALDDACCVLVALRAADPTGRPAFGAWVRGCTAAAWRARGVAADRDATHAPSAAGRAECDAAEEWARRAWDTEPAPGLGGLAEEREALRARLWEAAHAWAAWRDVLEDEADRRDLALEDADDGGAVGRALSSEGNPDDDAALVALPDAAVTD